MRVSNKVTLSIVLLVSLLLVCQGRSYAGFQWVGGKLVGNYGNQGTISSGGKNPVFTPVNSMPAKTGNSTGLPIVSSDKPNLFQTGSTPMASSPMDFVSQGQSSMQQNNPGSGDSLKIDDSTLKGSSEIKNPTFLDNTDDMDSDVIKDKVLAGQVIDNKAKLPLIAVDSFPEGQQAKSLIDEKGISIVYDDLQEAGFKAAAKAVWFAEANAIVLDDSLKSNELKAASSIVHEATHAQQSYRLLSEDSKGFAPAVKSSFEREYEAITNQVKFDKALGFDYSGYGDDYDQGDEVFQAKIKEVYGF